jgi:hypothetical protein
MMARTGRDAAALVHPHPADLQANSADRREHKPAKREEFLVPAAEIGYSSQAHRRWPAVRSVRAFRGKRSSGVITKNWDSAH